MAERFQTIVVDPPWRYTATPTRRAGAANRRGAPAEERYGTLGNEEMAGLPISDLAAEEAHLYLWVTNPVLTEQHLGQDGLSVADLILAWNFEPKSLLTWVKTGAPGLGWYWRGMTEHVVFATRGGLGIPADKRLPNLFEAPRTGHSVKPDLFLDLVEQVSPGPYLEMFARRARFGWDYWGDESLQTVELGTAP